MKKNIILVLSMLLILTMFLSISYVAFFGKDEMTKEKEMAEEQQDESNAEEQNKEEIKQHLKINIGTEPQTLHPGLAADIHSETVILQTFEGLTRINMWGQTKNATASVIKISDDQKTYWFTLRDTKWSNGDPVIAKDFEYAWKWILDPQNKSANAYQLYPIEGAKSYNQGNGSLDAVGVKAIDDKTLEVKLESQTPNFLELISLNAYYPINSKLAQQNPDWANEAGETYISNGPYMLAKWIHNEKIVLVKNNSYWDKNSVKLERISINMVDKPKNISQMYDNGSLNWGGQSTSKILEEDEQALIIDELPDTKSIIGTFTLHLNTNVEPFNNLNIRKALSLAINRENIVGNDVQMGGASALSAIPFWIIPENRDGYFKDGDITKAKEYLQMGLKELGYKDTMQLPKITLSIPEGEKENRIAESVQAMWNENLGIAVNIHSQDWDNHYINVYNSNYDVSLMNSIHEFNNPISYLEPYYNNYTSSWSNLEFQSYLEESQVEFNGERRIELIKKAEAELLEKMPFIPISFYTIEFLNDKELLNIAESKTGINQYKWAYFQ